MPKIKYFKKRFGSEARTIIDLANLILGEYQSQGYVLTLRQLYYQFVARGLMPNTQRDYKRLGQIVSDARLAGLIDWHMVEDRTRGLRSVSTWESPEQIVRTCADTFTLDKWEDQKYRVEVWIEKDALVGVFEPICTELQISYLSCRGYTSQSEMWVAGQRLQVYDRAGQTPVILHFGDHDPSGRDMTRDIVDRLYLFTGLSPLDRLALNMDQVEQYQPPPNPAKITDSRAAAYIAQFGGESWELDALEPAVLAELVRAWVLGLRDEAKWAARVAEEEEHRQLLTAVADKWGELTEDL
jgi:hypothetical protein